jgi:hypothetical protein
MVQLGFQYMDNGRMTRPSAVGEASENSEFRLTSPTPRIRKKRKITIRRNVTAAGAFALGKS